jgi:hypothetical protein
MRSPPDCRSLLEQNSSLNSSSSSSCSNRNSSSYHTFGIVVPTSQSDEESDNANKSEQFEEKEEEEEGAFDIHDHDSYSKRLQVLVCASYPVIISLLLSVSGNCIILYFAGYLSRVEDDPTIFSGVSLAITFANVTFCSVIDGLTTAVETLSSQYNGSKNYKMVRGLSCMISTTTECVRVNFACWHAFVSNEGGYMRVCVMFMCHICVMYICKCLQMSCVCHMSYECSSYVY